MLKEVIRDRWEDLGGAVLDTTTGAQITSPSAPDEFEVDLADYFDVMAGGPGSVKPVTAWVVMALIAYPLPQSSP